MSLVCFGISVHIGYHKDDIDNNRRRDWQIEHCHGPEGLNWDLRTYKYKPEINKYVHRCCLVPGIYNLICKNDGNLFGWGNASVEIFGQHYCDDFVGNMVIRKVKIKSKSYPL